MIYALRHLRSILNLGMTFDPDRIDGETFFL